jgi:prephenate dehydrogenase
MARRRFGKVGIVGLGLIGSSIGLALHNGRKCDEVFGFDTDTAARQKAQDIGAVTKTYDTLNHLGNADILIIAVPPPVVVPCLLEADIFCKEGCIVTDTTSTKGSILHWTQTYPLKFRPRFVGGHPMVGRERSGVDAAEAGLFEGATWVLTPTGSTDGKALATVRSLVETLGSRVLLLSPEEHDRHAAVLSHLPHAVAAALVKMGGLLTHPEMEGPSWRDLTRVAGSSPEMWQSIFTNNRGQVVSALEDLEYHLRELRQYIESNDQQKVLELLEEAKRIKDGEVV